MEYRSEDDRVISNDEGIRPSGPVTIGMKLAWVLALVAVAGCSHGPQQASANAAVARELPGGPLAHGVHAAHSTPAPQAFAAKVLMTTVGTMTRPDAQDLCLRQDVGRAAFVRGAIQKGGAVEFQGGTNVMVSYAASQGEPVRAIAANGLTAWVCGQDLDYPANAR